jgi:hypothetical protein
MYVEKNFFEDDEEVGQSFEPAISASTIAQGLRFILCVGKHTHEFQEEIMQWHYGLKEEILLVTFLISLISYNKFRNLIKKDP